MSRQLAAGGKGPAGKRSRVRSGEVGARGHFGGSLGNHRSPFSLPWMLTLGHLWLMKIECEG